MQVCNTSNNLISVNNATEIILNQHENFGVEKILFQNSLNRVLKENVIADRDFPPFDRVSMDGIAINFLEFKKGKKQFKIEGVQPAGFLQLNLKNSENCFEVMTGAILPKGVDTVIPYELVTIKNNIAYLNTENVKFFQNVHKQGRDRKKNDLILKKNTIINSTDIGILTTVGKEYITVAKNPKVIIISTGNELIDVNKKPLAHQIRRSNVYTLISLLEQLKIKAKTIHINDDKEQLKNIIKDLLKTYDVLLFSGAVSKGKFDYIPEVLDSLKVKKLFHKVSQRPGKPFWFGKKDNKTIFAFPGNPVSTFVNCLKYFYPWFKKTVGINYKNNNLAILSEDYEFKPDLTYFLQVKLTNKKGKIFATPITGYGSGDLANLVNVDAFLELPKGKNKFNKGEVLNYIPFR